MKFAGTVNGVHVFHGTMVEKFFPVNDRTGEKSPFVVVPPEFTGKQIADLTAQVRTRYDLDRVLDKEKILQLSAKIRAKYPEPEKLVEAFEPIRGNLVAGKIAPEVFYAIAVLVFGQKRAHEYIRGNVPGSFAKSLAHLFGASDIEGIGTALMPAA